MSYEEIAQRLGISRTALRSIAWHAQLKYTKVGTRKFYDFDEVMEALRDGAKEEVCKRK